MRITKVPAAAAPVVRTKLSWRWGETISLLTLSCLLGAGFWMVEQSKTAPLATAGQRLASGQTLLMRRAATPDEIAPYLGRYEDRKQRRFIAAQISHLVRSEAPGNAGAIAAIQITRADAERAGVLEFYRERFERAGGDRIRLFTFDEFARLKPSFAVRTPEEFRSAFRNWALAFFAVFWITHAVWTLIGFRGDAYVLPGAFLLSGIGMILMVSLRDPVRDLLIFEDFAFGVIAACTLLLAITAGSHFMELRSRGALKHAGLAGALLDFANGASRNVARRGDLAFLLSVVLSAALLLFGSGPGDSDARVRLGFFQPVEVIKFLLVLFLASYFARRWEYLRELRETRLRTGLNLPRLDHAVPVMIAVAVAIAFFFLQKDLGPAVILAGLFLCLYAVARRRVRLVLVAAGVLCATGWLAYRIEYPRIAVTRIGMWLSPWNNGLAHGEQVVHGLWAMATGGVLGAGIGAGQPEVIPAAHTDLILAALGEECGFIGLALVILAFALLFWRSLRIALRAPTDYEFFLALGVTLALALEGAFIAGGVVGILPLSGVVTPFLSYGSTAMLVNFACLGVLLAISSKPGRPSPNANFAPPVAILASALVLFGAAVLAKAAWVQTIKADDVVAAGTLVLREDGSYALAYNPRLLAIARQIPRGSIYDRTGLPLATSRWEELEKYRAAYAALGIDVERACSRDDSRHYPFGPAMFHLLGDLRTRVRWSASNAAFEERVARPRLQGFNDREVLDTVELPRTAKQVRVLRYDYSELVPLLRARMDPSAAAVRKLMDAPRDLRLSVDARLQARLTRAFQEYLRSHGWRTGAVAVIHPATGELLASLSVPLPETDPAAAVESPRQAIDLARFGEYPPGSAFKLVTAIAALRSDPSLESKKYECVRLPDGRVGNRVRGRWIRDDVQDHRPHGTLEMRAAIVHSCNAFFSQLGTYGVGAEQLLETAKFFSIDTARPNTAKALNEELPQAAYGQAQVLVTPLRLARVSGAIAAGGRLLPLRTHLSPSEGDLPERAVLDRALAEHLQAAMRGAVTSGTGREASKSAVAIAGKTGTAEIRGAPAHAWFTGFAPAGAPVDDRLAFAILVANARYGGAAAAPFARELVMAAQEATEARPRLSAKE
ncbi:MAG TPA: FtsW/RodA/SpoVE family cell cycle protein [Bryobacteraceae bacterium]|nr:FtsW/RodA/SpoVE family cell cycle protein [Bryobacteraceae bacterium]